METKMKMVNRRAAGSRHTSAKACRKGGFAAVRLLKLRETAGAAFRRPKRRASQPAKAIAQIVDVTAMSRVFENGSRKLPASGRRNREAEDHHHPDGGCGEGAPARLDMRREHREDRSSRRTSADPSNRNDSAATDTPKRPRTRRQRRSERRPDSAQREGGHAPDDPGRPASADIRPITPGWPAESEWRNARRPKALERPPAKRAPQPSRD